MVMNHKTFEKLLLTSVYQALDSQGIEVPEKPVIESLGPHISIKDGETNEIITVLYVVKSAAKQKVN
jgi:hypothetical protein